MASRELNILIKAKNLASAAIQGVTGDLKRLDKMGVTIGKGIRTAGKNIERGVVLAGGAAATGLGLAIKTAMDFEDAFAGVKKTVSETELAAAGLSFEDLLSQFREMARTMPIAFEDLAHIGEQAGQLGIKAKDIAAFTEVAAKLGVTTNLSSDEAADSLGRLGTILHLTGKDYQDVADALVNLGNKGASTESEILDVAKRFAASGRAAGLTTDEILALSSTVTSMGVENEAAGSSLSRLFDSVATNIGTSNKRAKAFADSLGLSAAQFKKAWQKDAIGTFQDFLKVLDGMDQFDQAKLLKDIGVTGTRDVRALRLLAGGWKQVAKDLDTAKDSQGALNTEASKRFATTTSKWKTFVNSLRDIGFVIGRELLPIVNDLLQDFAEFLAKPKQQQAIKQFAKDLAKNIRSVVDWLRKLDWDAIGNAMKSAAGAAKTIAEAFLNLPPWLQGAIASGWGLNKLTGGALGSLFGQLSAGLIKGILNMNAGVVNVRGAVVNVPGGGGPGIPGGGKPGVPGAPVVPPGGFLAPGLGTAALGIFSAFAMTGLVPYLFQGPKGSGNNSAQRQIGVDANGKPIMVTLDQKTTAMFQGLMPSFETTVTENGGKIVKATDHGTSVVDDSVKSAKAFLGQHLNDVRVQEIRTEQAALATKLAAERGLSTANSALHDVNANVARVAAKDFSPNISVTASFLGQFQISASAVASKVTILSNATRMANMTRRQGGILA